MAFYRSDPKMTAQLGEVLDRFAQQGRPSLHHSIAVTWIRYDSPNPAPCSGYGAGWSDNKLLYPASVIKLVYAIATEAWLQKDLILDSAELRRAMQNMLANSSNDATSLILDLLTGTSSGPSLLGEDWEAWKIQRNLINNWLHCLNWPELEKVNCCQKTWEDSPYGRERDFYGEGNCNRNSLSASATARILESVMTENLVSPQACKRLKKLLSRSLDLMIRKSNPENQVDGFLGEGLPKGSQLWSKAGWMSQAKHDAAWISSPEKNPMLLVVFSQGRQLANDSFLLPALASELCQLSTEKDIN